MPGGYATKRWRRLRRRYLQEHPRCACEACAELPEQQRPLATDVHHRDGKGLAGPRAYDWANLQALAHGHHSHVTRRSEQRTTSRSPGARRRPEPRHPGLLP